MRDTRLTGVVSMAALAGSSGAGARFEGGAGVPSTRSGRHDGKEHTVRKAGGDGETLEALHARLMTARRGEPVEDILARILASWASGKGCLPRWLGLGETEFQRMVAYHFPGLGTRRLEGAETSLELERGEELDDLRVLLLENRSGRTASEVWMAEIVITGCMGSDHLWQDLGLWSRAELSRLMEENFAPLAMRNDRDMKWKKFLYKQLCEAEGVYVCRSPSCEVCVDYHNCFGTED